jgi:hypothetical protein
LPDVGVEGVLHLPLKLDLPLPKQNLTLSLHYLSQNVRLLLLQRRNMTLELDRFVLKLFKFLFELVLDVGVVVSHLSLLCRVLVEVVQLFHLEVEVLQGDPSAWISFSWPCTEVFKRSFFCSRIVFCCLQ